MVVTTSSSHLLTLNFIMALEYPAIPPTLKTAIIASTPSISIIERPDWEKVPSPRLWHQSYSDLFRVSCVNQDLCNNKANLLTRLETCCNRILGTRPRMTGARDASLVSSANLLLNALFLKVSFFLPNPAKTC